MSDGTFLARGISLGQQYAVSSPTRSALMAFLGQETFYDSTAHVGILLGYLR